MGSWTAARSVGTRPVPALAARAGSDDPPASDAGTTVVVPANTPPGVYYAIACADQRSIIPEGNKVNNCAVCSSPATVTG